MERVPARFELRGNWFAGVIYISFENVSSEKWPASSASTRDQREQKCAHPVEDIWSVIVIGLRCPDDSTPEA